MKIELELTPTVEELIRPDIEGMDEYTPIEPVEVLAARFGIHPEAVIKLDANENPYGPSPRVAQALARYDGYHIYPDPMQRELRSLLAHYSGYHRDRIIAGNGSDELIDLIMRVFLQPGDEVISSPPTFGMYRFNAEVCMARAVSVPRKAGFALDVEAIERAITPRSKLIFLASPNNPTGNMVSNADVVRLLRTGLVVVLDEAYYEFADGTAAPLVREFNNLIVLRTFSKWAGLAGLRVGYGIFPREIGQHVMKIKPPYNINVAATVAVRATLADLGTVQQTVRLLRHERGRLYRQLRKLNFIQPYPSQANFILCKVLLGGASQLKRNLERRGIFVRHFGYLPDYLRISVGKPEHTDRLMAALLQSLPY